MEKEKKFEPKYLAAEVAERFSQSQDFEKNPLLGRLALDKLKLDKDAMELLKKDPHYLESEGIASAAKIYSEMSKEQFDSQKVKDLYGFYKKNLDYISKEDQKKVEFVFKNLGDKTLGNIRKEFDYAQRFIEGYSKDEILMKNYKDKDKEIAKAQKTINKYSKFLSIYGIVHEEKLSEIEKPIIKEYKKKTLETLLKDVSVS